MPMRMSSSSYSPIRSQKRRKGSKNARGNRGSVASQFLAHGMTMIGQIFGPAVSAVDRTLSHERSNITFNWVPILTSSVSIVIGHRGVFRGPYVASVILPTTLSRSVNTLDLVETAYEATVACLA
ncbi:hypothetical protein B0H11DRAFT_1902013 [Mycena galericulata]|nr:hypothetical protein B0H11DRAFT_1902013 [Mycena galericulata]